MSFADLLKTFLGGLSGLFLKSAAKGKQVLVVYFEGVNLSAALVDISSNASEPKQIHLGPIEASLDEDGKKKALAEILNRFHLKSYPKTLLVWGDGVTFRQLTMPSMPPADLRQAIIWDLKKKYFYNPEESSLAYAPVADVEGQEGPEKLYNLFYMDKKTVTSRLDLVLSQDANVEAMFPSQCAIAMALKVTRTSSKPAENDTLVCDLNDGVARILAVSDGKVMMVRNVTLLPPGAVLSEESLTKLSDEIQKSIDYYSSQKLARPFAEIVFSGAGFEEATLKSFMEQKLELPVKFLKNAALIGAAFIREESINLLPDVMKKRNQDRQINDMLKMGFFGCSLIFSTLIGWPILEMSVFDAQMKAIEKESSELLKTEKAFIEFTSKERARRTAMRGRVRHGALLKEMSRVTPSNVVLQDMQFNRLTGDWNIRGIINDTGKENVGIVTQFVAALTELPFFKSVALVNSSPETDREKFKFEIKATLRGVE